MQAKEIKPGSVVNYNGNPILIKSLMVQTPSARGAATLYKFRGKNVVTSCSHVPATPVNIKVNKFNISL